MSIKRFQQVTYEEYCTALASMEGKEVALNLPGPLMKWIGDAKEAFQQIADMAKVSLGELLEVFKNRDAFALLKAIGFSIKRIMKALKALSALVSKGLLHTMEEFAKSDLMQKLREGTIKIDEVLNKYPIIKQLAGPALAGLLFYIWLNMTFVGDWDYDMDISVIIEAFLGKFLLADLFTSKEGLSTLALFAFGTFTGISVAWLGSSALNAVVALLFTLAKRLHKNGLALKIKPLMDFKRYG